MRQAVRFVNGHGFNSYVFGSTLVIEIPYLNAISKTEGTDYFAARSIKRVKQILGY